LASLQTEFEFTLPRGYVDADGNVHRKGRMRLATALDEITPLRDPRVRQNQAYLIIILLANVITQLGELTYVSTFEVEKFFTSDLAFLQRLYRQINERGTSIITVQCPECSTEVEVDIASLGGSLATPSNESMRR
jgi:hypothetical protein